jgi:hypothetical protein
MRTGRMLLAALLMLILVSGTDVSTATQLADQGESLAGMTISSSQITWKANSRNAGLVLTIAAPDGTVVQQTFAPNTLALLSITGPDGQPRPDGSYTYELRAIPILSEAIRQQLAAASEADRNAIVAQLRQSGALPAELAQVGHFQIIAGTFVIPSAGPEPVGITTQDVVTADDMIVQGSLCVGFDCIDNEVFGFDTVRLKENNLRIKFEDTSVGTFPANDWQLTANDTNSGGASRFSIDDITGATTPFTIMAGAPSNALFISNSGQIGLRTAAPVLSLHAVRSDTPGVRLEQDNSGGFTAQTWDIAGNEANFFIRDLTSGSRLPFRIRPGAPTSSIDIAGTGNVGIGISSPQQKLHVAGNTQIDGSLQVEGRVTELSDMHAKQDFAAVDGQMVLLRLRKVPVLTWRYRTDLGCSTWGQLRRISTPPLG